MLRIPPVHLLACPNCQSDVESGFMPQQQHCKTCKLDLFDLNGLPCWFSTGLKQREVWQNLFAQIVQNGKKNLSKSEEYDSRLILPSSQTRLQKQKKLEAALLESIRILLTEAGLKAVVNPEFSNHDASHILEYYELLLRDWAWDTEKANRTVSIGEDTVVNTPTTSENESAFQRVKKALTSNQHQLGHTWVIGCGAGRLSVDIHTKLNAESTIALDVNLILINAAHRMAGQRLAWQLIENSRYPQLGFENGLTWSISQIKYSEDELQNWFAIAGDAWNPPLKPASFDTIVTPWFIDVNGKEPAALIGLVQKYLKPGGLWINTGPLLYSASLHSSQRLNHGEILELLNLAGFTVLHQDTEVSAYLDSPLNTQQRFEQVWTFAAQAPNDSSHTSQNVPDRQANMPYPWIILPHLPIPKNTPLKTHGNPVLERLAVLVDGTHSVNSIADIMRTNLDEGKDPLSVVRSAFLEFLLKKDDL